MSFGAMPLRSGGDAQQSAPDAILAAIKAKLRSLQHNAAPYGGGGEGEPGEPS